MPIAADRLDEAEEWMRLLLVPNLPVPLALRAVQTFGGVAEALSAPLKELAPGSGWSNGRDYAGLSAEEHVMMSLM